MLSRTGVIREVGWTGEGIVVGSSSDGKVDP